MVAAIGEQILGPTDVLLSNWTVRPSSGCSVVLATHTAGVSVDGYTLTLAANMWNIVRTYNLTPGRELLFACRYRLGTASNFVVHMSEADNVYDPLYGSFVGDQGAWSTAKMYFTVPPNGVAKLHFGAHFQAPGLPNQTAGTVDVYGLQILDATLEAGNTAEEEDTAASALLLKHEFLDGGADDVTLATLGKVLLEPTLTTLGNFLVRSNSQSSVASASFTVGGFQLEGYAMTLSAFAWNIVRTYTLAPGRRYSFGCRYRLGTASNLVMYVSAADNDYVGVTGTFLGTPSQGVWSTARLDFSVPPGGIAKLHFGAFGGSIPGLVQQSAGTLDLYSMQIRASAFEGDSVSVADLLADSLALTGSATLDGLTAQGNVGCDQLLCNDVNCTDVFTTGVDASGAVSCAALTATGTVAGATLTSTGAVSGSSLSISGATGITGSTLTINNTANAGNFTTVGDVSTGTLTASGAATAASFAATGAFTREAAVEPLQKKNAETVGRATKRAARELTGDDGNFVVTTDLGNEFATLDRELPAEAVHRTKRPEDRNALAVVDRGIQTLKKDLATRVARKGGQWSRPLRPTTRGPTRRRTAPRKTWRSSRPQEFRVLQDNADKFQHNKDLTNRRIKAVEDAGAFRAPTNAARSFNPQYGDAQQLRAVDSMTVRSTEGRETLLKLALPAPQGSGNAAGRLTRRGRPAAVRQLDDFLAPPRPRTLD